MRIETRKHCTVFLLTGISYVTIEVIYSAVKHGVWRLEGTSSVWMLLVGGMLGVLTGLFDSAPFLTHWLSYRSRVFMGAMAITLTEFLSGCLLNLKLGFDLWDYSRGSWNLLGQVDGIHSLCWLALTPAIFWLNAVIGHYVYGEERPVALSSYYIKVIGRIDMMPID